MLCGEYWYVGPIFCIVVLLWYYGRSLKPNVFTSLLFLFLVLSTLIYALVFHIAKADEPGWMFEPFDMLAVGVSVGSILLPVVHVLILGGTWKRSVITSVLLILSYFGVYYLFVLLEKIGFFDDYFIYILVYVWQGVSLLRFFRLEAGGGLAKDADPI